MKKILLAFFLLFFYLFPGKNNLVLAADTQATATSELTVEKSATDSEKINYELPYPGMLPDNPLYFLKAIRDKIIKILINDSVKKVEFSLLTSDKRLAAGEYLIKKKKTPLAITTISKSNNYFFEAVKQAKEAQDLGKDTAAVIEKLNLAFKKHEQVFGQLITQTEENYKKLFQEEAARQKSLEESLKLLSQTQ